MSRRPRLGQANPALSTLYNAPDLLESRRLRNGIAEIATDLIQTDGRLDDRLQLDVDGLKASIEQNGQRVPILVRPLPDGKYRLIYGRRRLEALRQLALPVRAIVTELDEQQSLKDQLLENLERRDLSFIERAMVAAALLEGEHLAASDRSAKAVAEILNLTEAGVSQLLGVIRSLGQDLVQAIGAAPAIGRPRWEELKKALSARPELQGSLIDYALELRNMGKQSDEIFTLILERAKPAATQAPPAVIEADDEITLGAIGKVQLRNSNRGKRLQIDLKSDDKAFLAWMQQSAPDLIGELYDRWQRSEDNT